MTAQPNGIQKAAADGSMVQAVRAHNELVVQPNVIEGAARLVETMTGRLSASAPSEENTDAAKDKE